MQTVMKAIAARAALVLGLVLPGSGAGPALRAADHDVEIGRAHV